MDSRTAHKKANGMMQSNDGYKYCRKFTGVEKGQSFLKRVGYLSYFLDIRSRIERSLEEWQLYIK